jgi:hypothetical protein
MSFQSLNPELTAKVLLLANLQRNLVRFYSVKSMKINYSDAKSKYDQ